MTRGSGPSRKRRKALYAVAVIVLVAAWLASGFYTIEPSQRGVVTRFGRLVADNVQPGLHYNLPWPIGKVHKPRTTEVRRMEVGYTMLGRKFSEPRRSDMVTGDENILKIMMVVQYRVATPPARYVFGAQEPDWLVERAVEAALSAETASRRVDDILTTAKSDIQRGAIERAQKLLDAYGAGLTLIDANLQEVKPPTPVSDAFVDVNSAKKDAEQLIERARELAARTIAAAESDASRRIEAARGRYAERVSRAQGDARRFLSLLPEFRGAADLTATRLYWEAMERILARARIVVLAPPRPDQPTEVTIFDNP